MHQAIKTLKGKENKQLLTIELKICWYQVINRYFAHLHIRNLINGDWIVIFETDFIGNQIKRQAKETHRISLKFCIYYISVLPVYIYI